MTRLGNNAAIKVLTPLIDDEFFSFFHLGVDLSLFNEIRIFKSEKGLQKNPIIEQHFLISNRIIS